MARRPIRAFDDGRALALRAVHDAPRVGIERVAAMHRAAIVPDQDVADFPLVMPRGLRPRGVRPQRIEQSFGFRQRQAAHVSVGPPSEV